MFNRGEQKISNLTISRESFWFCGDYSVDFTCRPDILIISRPSARRFPGECYELIAPVRVP